LEEPFLVTAPSSESSWISLFGGSEGGDGDRELVRCLLTLVEFLEREMHC
jgi:hypothetical protein